jgi:transitional endoplasmic reticulum ATPase
MAQQASARHSTLNPLIQLWLLRLLVPLGGHSDFIGALGFSSDSLARALGLGDMMDPVSGEFDERGARLNLRRLHRAIDKGDDMPSVRSSLTDNIARLATVVGLTQTDCRILEFAVLVHTDQALGEAGDTLGFLSTAKLVHILSILLGLPGREIQAALGAQSVMARSGLVVVDRSERRTLCGKLDLLSDTFANYVIEADADPLSLLRDTVTLSPEGHLTMDDFSHAAHTLDVLRPYLRQSISTGRKGVNVFMHGRPGTGKSQLAKALAKEVGCELFEVASEDSDGDPVTGARRLRAFRAAQSFFSSRQAIILFDEAEDVFSDSEGAFGRKSTAQTRKAWMNRMLEENAVPTIWLSNSRGGMDPAFIRRFDMVFELPVPPKGQRARIINQASSGMLDARRVAMIAESDALAPAVVTKAASVVQSIRGVLGEDRAAAAIEMLISGTLEAQGHAPIPPDRASRLPDLYDPALVHADADLHELARGLVKCGSGRLCMYGPPGTGKTAFGRWLAEEMGVPLHVKRASDLMSMWVGGNERNIAQVFRQAQAEGALLLIDEVDSFLRDRRFAKAGWEASMVNEMLTQMESFAGVFIASTNLMEGLDQAALRRFDLKVKFDYLRFDQASQMLCRYCESMALGVPMQAHFTRLATLTMLTPGDFAAVVRQVRFRPVASTDALVLALEAECSIKEDYRAARSPMGFL